MTAQRASARTAFHRLLAEKRVLVADGAMGTILFDLGLETGGCPELLNVERPDLIGKVHRGYIEAGSDIVLTNTFGANQCRLELHGAEKRVTELNEAAVAIARRTADSALSDVAVAGSIGPTGELFEPLGTLGVGDGIEIFSEQASALVAAGADVLWIETLSSWEELEAAFTAACGRGVPVVTTLSFDTNGHTMMGLAPAEFAAWWNSLDERPTALGANCGVGPADVVAAAAQIAAAAPAAPVVAKGNCGIPLYKEDALAYPAGPEVMASYIELAIRSGARIVGSCCGSGFDHVAAIRAAVDSHPGGEPPSRTEIAERLGQLAEAAAGNQPERRRGRRDSRPAPS